MHQDSRLKTFLYKLMRIIPDRLYLSLKFYKNFGRFPDWKNPTTFNEKLQWLKLHNRRPEYTKMVDKYEAKNYVAGIIGEEYIIPTLGVWDRAEDIDFDSLPDRFVLKATHDSGRVVICKDKSTFDREKARQEMEKSLHRDFYAVTREWPYKNVKRRIIAEQYISNGYDDELTDYKFYCFNGAPRYCQVIRDRNRQETIDFYDMDWQHQEFVGLNPIARNSLSPIPRPANLDTMREICCNLAKDEPFVRIDLYEVDDTTYFGEMTFYPNSGIGTFSPQEWNERIGDLLKLPTANRGGYNIKIINGLCEITPVSDELKDYKFFCFNGNPCFVKVDFGRFSEHHANYYDLDWNLLPFGEADFPPVPEHVEEKPLHFDRMVDMAHRLSAGHPFLRVDLYNVNGRVRVGELTLFPASGIGRLTPESQDTEWGKLLSIASISGGVNR